MLPEARRRSILSHLSQVNSDTIVDLSQRYHVSTMTIRRDLRSLERGGYVTMTHGGAIFDGGAFQQNESHQIERAAIRSAEKRAIGRYVAANFVDDDDVVFLDSGTTVRAIVPYLKDKSNLTTASNSIRTIQALFRILPQSTILCTGGWLAATAQSFVGPVAERFFEDFFARRAIISGVGFSIQSGLADSQLLDSAVKKAVIRSAESSIVVIDSSKIGHSAMVQVLATSEIHTLVTDDDISTAMQRDIEAAGIDLHIVPVKYGERALIR